MTKTTKLCAIAVSLGVSLGAAGVALHQVKANAAGADEYAATITSAMQGDTIVLLNGDVADFALNYTKCSATNYVGANSGYLPKPATISWENTRDGAEYYTLKVGLEQDLSDAASYLVSDTSADIDYLYTAKHYYYQVYAHYDNDEVVKSRVFDFYTADTPRTVYIEGVTNTRDIGGRYVMGGQYQVKQGMVYRGAEVDRELGAITEEGRRVMLYDLGIKTDLDIRGGDVQNAKGTSPIDDSLNYIHLEAPWYSHVFKESYKEAFTTEIRTFANPDNYPIYFHCSVGRDRAGTLSLLLGALLGVSEEDLYRDYEMSFFSSIGLTDAAQSAGDYNNLITSFTNTITYIKTNYPAATFMESTAEWMKDYLGITQEEIDTIRNTLWEETNGVKVDNSAVKKSVSRVKDNKAKVVSADDDFPCTYSANPDKLYKGYGSSAVTAYTAEEAAAAGIPAGYEGTVLKVTTLASNASVGCGVLLDYTAENIPLGVIESLQFRVYIGTVSVNEGTNYPQIRIPTTDGSGNWVYQVNQANASGEWITVTIPYNSNFEAISKNGNLATFELSLRTKGETVFYVDSAKCVMKKPVITYTGEDTLSVSLGKALYLPATAADALGNALELQYVWADGVELNANGTPTQMGTYALTVKAVDAWGNATSKAFTVVVEAAGNTTPPTIHLNYETVKAMVGTKSMLSVDATDDNGKVDIVTSWSNGALDKRGNLTAGEHIWTITATDKYGNVTTETVTFVVTENEPTYTTVIDEASEAGYFTVTIDGKAMTVPYGVKIDKPIDPVRETTAEAKYTFLGWYVGDEEWDFNSVITSDLEIQSKWQETKQTYKVSFDGKVAASKVEYGNVIPVNLIPETPTKEPTSREQYTFEGWYNGDVLWNFETDVVTGNTVLVSKFTKSPRLYTVTFDGENATEYEYGSKIVKPADPVKEGTDTVRYEFAGWYYLGKAWDFDNDVVTYNIKLQAKWEKVTMDVEEPDGPVIDSGVNNDSDVNTDSGNDAEEPATDLLAGCSGVIGGVASGLTALGVAAYVLLKKKEN